MATGTGKTFTAFQIIYRLWKSRRFSPDFFDLVVIDECHRGSAREDSAWREILEYFDSAIHLGLTATPKETEYISNITYFGEPIYTYSLRQGIADGFLAPYKVIRIAMDKDDGWRPDEGMIDRYGSEIPDQVYELPDFDRLVTLSERTKTVATRLTQFLANTNPMSKTIIFCENIEHAEHMRSALVNASATNESTATAATDGITTIEDTAVLRLPPVSHLGGIKELVQPFGGTRDGFLAAIHELETELYREDDAGGAA